MFIIVCFNPYNQIEDCIGPFTTEQEAVHYADSQELRLAYVTKVYPPMH
jgi:hypothetical protein